MGPRERGLDIGIRIEISIPVRWLPRRAGWRPIATAAFAIAIFAASAALSTANAHAQIAPQDVPDDQAPEQGRMLRAAARLYGLDPALLTAIAAVESNGNPLAVSPKGAQGLMQLMPATAAQFGVGDPFDPIENTLGAARFLSHLRQWQASRPDLAINLPELIAAYNAGPGAIEKYHGIPPYLETRQYVRKVLISYLIGGPTRRYPLTPVAQGPGAPAMATIDRRPVDRGHLSHSDTGRAERVLLIAPPDPIRQLDDIRRMRALAQGREARDQVVPREALDQSDIRALPSALTPLVPATDPDDRGSGNRLRNQP
jgi:Transglycosylase SLT domain